MQVEKEEDRIELRCNTPLKDSIAMEHPAYMAVEEKVNTSTINV